MPAVGTYGDDDHPPHSHITNPPTNHLTISPSIHPSKSRLSTINSSYIQYMYCRRRRCFSDRYPRRTFLFLLLLLSSRRFARKCVSLFPSIHSWHDDGPNTRLSRHLLSQCDAFSSSLAKNPNYTNKHT